MLVAGVVYLILNHLSLDGVYSEMLVSTESNATDSLAEVTKSIDSLRSEQHALVRSLMQSEKERKREIADSDNSRVGESQTADNTLHKELIRFVKTRNFLHFYGLLG